MVTTVLAVLAAISAVLPPVQRFRLEISWHAEGPLGLVAIGAPSLATADPEGN